MRVLNRQVGVGTSSGADQRRIADVANVAAPVHAQPSVDGVLVGNPMIDGPVPSRSFVPRKTSMCEVDCMATGKELLLWMADSKDSDETRSSSPPPVRRGVVLSLVFKTTMSRSTSPK